MISHLLEEYRLRRLTLTDKVLHAPLHAYVLFLQKELAETDRLIQRHIDHDDALRRKAPAPALAAKRWTAFGGCALRLRSRSRRNLISNSRR